MPIVVMNDGVQLSSQKRSRRHDLPTPAARQRREATWSAPSPAEVFESSSGRTRVADKEELDEKVVVRRDHSGQLIGGDDGQGEGGLMARRPPRRGWGASGGDQQET